MEKQIEHNFMWAVREMKLGKKVRRPYFQEDFYWHSFNKETIVNKRNEPVMASYFPELEAIDWEIYEEPNKTLYDKRIYDYDADSYTKHSEKTNSYIQTDVKEAIKEYISALSKSENTNKTFQEIGRSIFGKEMI